MPPSLQVHDGAQLCAGVGRANITPSSTFPMGLWRAATHLRAEGIHRPIFTTCIILDCHPKQIAILNLELMLLSVSQVRSIQAAVSEVTGIEATDIWVFVTHNHAGPATLEDYLGEGELVVKAYCEEIPRLCADAAKKAKTTLVPARVGAGRGRCDIGINRDLKLPDGKFIIAPNPDGYVDSEVGVVKIESLDGRPIAVIANYACHPTIAGHENKLISPDYPGVVRDVVEQITGAVCLFLQGAAGNVGPREGFTASMEVVERQGAILGCEVAKVALQTETSQTRAVFEGLVGSMSAQLGIVRRERVEGGRQVLHALTRSVEIPTGNPFGLSYTKLEEDINALEAETSVVPAAQRESPAYYNKHIALNRLIWIRERGRRMHSAGTYSVEIRALCVGDVALVGSWGELFAETGSAIKANSPFPHTLVAAYMGGDAAYVPVLDAYSSNPSLEVMNTPVAPGGAEFLASEISSLLADLKNLSRAGQDSFRV
jgi:hypothetical protein